MSLRVSDGIGSGTPGRLTPLCERDGAADDHLAERAAVLDLADAQPHEPVVDQHVVARLQHVADHGGRDGQLAVLAPLLCARR